MTVSKPLTWGSNMITDMHCHFVPEEFFRFAQSRDEFAIKIKRREGDAVDQIGRAHV